jgi:hypothetical protein
MSWYRNHGSDRFAIFNRMGDIPAQSILAFMIRFSQ